MSALGFALAATWLGLVLGEGATWLALAVLFGQLVRAARRGAAPPIAPLPGAIGFGLYLGAGALAWGAGGYGCLRPHALARLAPLLAWPLVATAVRRVGMMVAARALAAGFALLLVAVAWSAWHVGQKTLGGDAWLRLDTLAGEQGLVPGGSGRVLGGFYLHRLKMAHVLLVALGPLVARQLLAPMAPRRRAVEAIALWALAAALAATYARAAYVGAAAGGLALAAVAFVQQPQMRPRLLYAATLGVLLGTCGLVAAPGVRARMISSATQDAADVRGIIWSQAVRIIAQHPLGVGLGNYPAVVGRYYAIADPLTASPITYPHSVMWAAWAEAGPMGALGLMAFWAAPWVAAARVLGARARGPQSDAARTAAGAWLFIGTALWVVGLTHDVLFHAEVALAHAAALGAAQGLGAFAPSQDGADAC